MAVAADALRQASRGESYFAAQTTDGPTIKLQRAVRGDNLVVAGDGRVEPAQSGVTPGFAVAPVLQDLLGDAQGEVDGGGLGILRLHRQGGLVVRLANDVSEPRR